MYRVNNEDKVAATFFGEGAASEGGSKYFSNTNNSYVNNIFIIFFNRFSRSHEFCSNFRLLNNVFM